MCVRKEAKKKETISRKVRLEPSTSGRRPDALPTQGRLVVFFDGGVSRSAFRLVLRFLPVRNQVSNRKQGRHWAGGFVRRGGLRVAL